MGQIVGLDYGSARMGVAVVAPDSRVARAHATVSPSSVGELLTRLEATLVVIGLPRNLDGDETSQTAEVRRFVTDDVEPLGYTVIYQDEAGTSSLAEERLKRRGKRYSRGDIDAEAAALILQDYLDSL